MNTLQLEDDQQHDADGGSLQYSASPRMLLVRRPEFPKLDQLISRANFMHSNNEGTCYHFRDEVEAWMRRHGDYMTLPDVLAVLTAAQDKICHPDFPSDNTSGYRMGHITLRLVKQAVRALIYWGIARQEYFHLPYLDFALQMIDVGPTSSHVEFISSLNDSDVEFYEYLKSLRGEDLSRVIRALMKQYKPDQGMVWDRYQTHLERFMRIFIINAFSEEQREESRNDFIDVHMYFTTAFNTREKNIRKQMREFARWIELKYDWNLFKGIKNVERLRRHLASIKKVILAPEYPQEKYVEETSKRMVHCLLQTVSDELLLCEMYNEIMDFALQLSLKKRGSQAAKDVFEMIGNFFVRLKEDSFKDNDKLHEGLVVKLTHLLDNIGDETFLAISFARPVVDHVLCAAMVTSRDHAVLWINMIKALLKHPTENCMSAACDAINKDKILKWKDYPEQVKEIFAILSKLTIPDWVQREYRRKVFCYFKDFADCLLDGVEKAKLQKNIKEDMVFFVFHCIELRDEQLLTLACDVMSKMNFNGKTNKPLVMKIIRFLYKILSDDTYGWLKEDIAHELPCLVQTLAQCVDKVRDWKVFCWEELEDMVSLCLRCQQGGFVRDDDNLTAYYYVYITISGHLYQWVDSVNEMNLVNELLPGVIDMLESDNDIVRVTGAWHVQTVTRSGTVGGQYIDRLIQIFLETESDSVLSAISNIYEQNTEALTPYFQNLFEHLDSSNTMVKSQVGRLLQKVAECQPDIFTHRHVDALMKHALKDTVQQTIILTAVEEITKQRPEKITPFIEQLTTPSLWSANCADTITNILHHYAVRQEVDGAAKIVDYMIEVIQTSSDKGAVGTALRSVRLIGAKHRSLLKKYRRPIEKFRSTTKDRDQRSDCTLIINMLDEESIKNFTDESRLPQQDKENLEIGKIIVGTEVNEVKDTTRHQGKDLDKKTIANVQELDEKTSGHLPSWARDISKLLKPEQEADWQTLSRRLGYNDDDMRKWAQQPDPCTAMLNEWYTTHDTRDATLAVLTALQDMGREDAAVMVEIAMKNTGGVGTSVQDETFEDSTPRDIFISYPPGSQNEAQSLKEHLEMAGYTCWLDLEHLEVEDELFQKIQSRIEEVKVVICCINEDYFKSHVCEKEVTISAQLEKPIIPLLAEETQWPPSNNMKTIFEDNFYINFFQSPDKTTESSGYWSSSIFQELLWELMCLKDLVRNTAFVRPEYRYWWDPELEATRVDTQDGKPNDKLEKPVPVTDSDSTKVTVSPDVFISYQWGKQPQVKKLYEALTSRGFTCWLDIKQMGGGDSLYDKIDEGIRGCRVVVSCITSKYALSPNCRREVSLADHLKKPLLPLLLEKTDWPPPGPMGVILTEKIYIKIIDPALQENWSGEKFEELVEKISKRVSGPGPAPIAVLSTASPTAYDPSRVRGELCFQGNASHPADDSIGNPPAPPSTHNEAQDAPQDQDCEYIQSDECESQQADLPLTNVGSACCVVL